MARERYLVNAGEDTIHDPEAEKKAEQADKTPRGKWDNFWYYHKWHVVIAAVAAVVVAYSVVSSLRAVQPDYTVGFITKTPYPDAVLEQLGQQMEKYGVDRNGDGKVVVTVVPYTISQASASGASSKGGYQEDPQVEMASRTKLMADVSVGTSMIFLTDDASFTAQEKSGNRMFAYTDGSTPKDSATDYDRMRVAVSKCPRLSGLTVTYENGTQNVSVKLADLMNNVSVSLRIYQDSSIAGKEDAYYQASKTLFRKLTT